MKLYTIGIGLLLFVVLTSNRMESEALDDEQLANVVNAALPAMTGLISMCISAVPVGPLLVGALSLIHVGSMVLIGGEDDEEQSKALTSLQIEKSQLMISSQIEKMGASIESTIQQVFNKMLQTLSTKELIEKMRVDCADIQKKYNDKIKIIMDSKITGIRKNTTLIGLLDMDSPLLSNVRLFIEKYITPNNGSPMNDRTKLMYELLLEEHYLKALENEDTYKESLHVQFFKYYMYLAKLLTQGYVLPILGHAMQYQKELKANLASDAAATKSNAEDLINDYKNDMKKLVDKTKWALDKASRDVRNPGSFELVKGKTFEHSSFCQTIPRIMHLSRNGCNEEAGPLNLKDFETGNCNTYGDIIPTNSQLSIFYDPNDDERPYQYMKVTAPSGSEQLFGHENSDSSLSEQQSTISDQCPTVFCPAYKKNAFAISTQRLRADYGNAITGLRFRVENKTLYIDIQQGKFKDLTAVEPNVYWTKSPSGGPVTYLSSSLNKLEIGEFEVAGDNVFMKSIHMRPGRGIINSYIEGNKAPQFYAESPIGSMNKIPESNELRVFDSDNAEKASENLKTKMSPLPKGERSYISLQPTSIKKDMGRTCYPLFDTREVTSTAPLCGFGIYHNTLGVIGLKGITCKLGHLVDYKQIEQFTETVKIA